RTYAPRWSSWKRSPGMWRWLINEKCPDLAHCLRVQVRGHRDLIPVVRTVATLTPREYIEREGNKYPSNSESRGYFITFIKRFINGVHFGMTCIRGKHDTQRGAAYYS